MPESAIGAHSQPDHDSRPYRIYSLSDRGLTKCYLGGARRCVVALEDILTPSDGKI